MTWLDSLDEVKKRDWAQAPMEERRAKAREVVDVCSYGACLAGAMPIPLMDLAILLPVHSAMVMTVGHVFGRSITQTEAKKIAVELGAVAGLSFAGVAAISALKRLLLPGVGGLLSIPATFALTWGLGRAAIAYFEEPDLARDELKRIFEDALKEGKSVFSPEAFERFRQKAKEQGGAPASSAGSAPPEPSPSSPPRPAAERGEPGKSEARPAEAARPEASRAQASRPETSRAEADRQPEPEPEPKKKTETKSGRRTL